MLKLKLAALNNLAESTQILDTNNKQFKKMSNPSDPAVIFDLVERPYAVKDEDNVFTGVNTTCDILPKTDNKYNIGSKSNPTLRYKNIYAVTLNGNLNLQSPFKFKFTENCESDNFIFDGSSIKKYVNDSNITELTADSGIYKVPINVLKLHDERTVSFKDTVSGSTTKKTDVTGSFKFDGSKNVDTNLSVKLSEPVKIAFKNGNKATSTKLADLSFDLSERDPDNPIIVDVSDIVNAATSTDEKVTQLVTTADNVYNILTTHDDNATKDITSKNARFSKFIGINASTGDIVSRANNDKFKKDGTSNKNGPSWLFNYNDGANFGSFFTRQTSSGAIYSSLKINDAAFTLGSAWKTAKDNQGNVYNLLDANGNHECTSYVSVNCSWSCSLYPTINVDGETSYTLGNSTNVWKSLFVTNTYNYGNVYIGANNANAQTNCLCWIGRKNTLDNGNLYINFSYIDTNTATNEVKNYYVRFYNSAIKTTENNKTTYTYITKNIDLYFPYDSGRLVVVDKDKGCGSSSQPIYINARGVAQPCGDINFGANTGITTSTKTINSENDSNVKLFMVNKTSVIANENGVAFLGFNTIGSTIAACCQDGTDGSGRTGSSYAGKHYGFVVSGSDLCWVGLDHHDGGQSHPYSDGNLGLTGTWVKCSGMSNTDNGKSGIGIYRRIS